MLDGGQELWMLEVVAREDQLGAAVDEGVEVRQLRDVEGKHRQQRAGDVVFIDVIRYILLAVAEGGCDDVASEPHTLVVAAVDVADQHVDLAVVAPHPHLDCIGRQVGRLAQHPRQTHEGAATDRRTTHPHAAIRRLNIVKGHTGLDVDEQEGVEVVQLLLSDPHTLVVTRIGMVAHATMRRGAAGATNATAMVPPRQTPQRIHDLVTRTIIHRHTPTAGLCATTSVSISVGTNTRQQVGVDGPERRGRRRHVIIPLANGGEELLLQRAALLGHIDGPGGLDEAETCVLAHHGQHVLDALQDAPHLPVDLRHRPEVLSDALLKVRPQRPRPRARRTGAVHQLGAEILPGGRLEELLQLVVAEVKETDLSMNLAQGVLCREGDARPARFVVVCVCVCMAADGAGTTGV
mmetsp:Transcript_48592/g.121634  ORF Transcript_48592/g.121634 Transcript_48592/m.121634 type:complete len:407 (-) Transcript_48592:1030-2250(-)